LAKAALYLIARYPAKAKGAWLYESIKTLLSSQLRISTLRASLHTWKNRNAAEWERMEKEAKRAPKDYFAELVIDTRYPVILLSLELAPIQAKLDKDRGGPGMDTPPGSDSDTDSNKSEVREQPNRVMSYQ
jgi:hypothetical protein